MPEMVCFFFMNCTATVIGGTLCTDRWWTLLIMVVLYEPQSCLVHHNSDWSLVQRRAMNKFIGTENVQSITWPLHEPFNLNSSPGSCVIIDSLTSNWLNRPCRYKLLSIIICTHASLYFIFRVFFLFNSGNTFIFWLWQTFET